MFETDKEILQNFLIREYTQSHIKFIGEGWSSIVYQVDDYIVRFPKQNISDYEFEAFICNKLRHDIFVDVPEVQILLDVQYPYIKHKKIIGNKWNDNKGNSRLKLGQDCARFLYQIHSFKLLENVRQIPGSDTLDIGRLESKFSCYYSRDKSTYLCKRYEKICQYPVEDTVLIHADFHTDNVVLDYCGRLKGVLDWCNAGVGERARDFIHLYSNEDRGLVKIVFSEYKLQSGIDIDEGRIRDLTLANLIDRLYWTDAESDVIHKMSKRIEMFI